MALAQKNSETQITAVIYCRVSDRKQKTEGHGLESQEHRCRQYAEEKGYAVEAVFPDDISGGGNFLERPGMRAMLAYLDAQVGKPYVVIFDDLKRFARDTEFHIKLRREFADRGARVECLNFKFEDSPEGRFIETIIAAQGQLEREQGSRQVIQKMKARVEKGYYVFNPPTGYKYAKDRLHGKLLVRDEPVASIITEALEGYASGRFRSQYEVKRFLERQPAFFKSGASGYVHPSRVKEMLMKPVYAGYIEAPNWGVSLRKGHHDPLIDFKTHERIQTILRGAVYAPARKDINEDFPLRGFVACDDCGKPMTSCWSKGRNKLYPYYLCDTPNCCSKRKSIQRTKIEGGAEAILKALQPAGQLVAMAKAMFEDIWNARMSEAKEAQRALSGKLEGIEKQIESLLDRIVDTNSDSVITAYESRIGKLERQKLGLHEKIENTQARQGHPTESIEPALKFLLSPWNIYQKGSFALRQTVLRMVFTEPLRYSRENGYRTANITFPFKVLAGFSIQKSEMVPPHGPPITALWLYKHNRCGPQNTSNQPKTNQ